MEAALSIGLFLDVDDTLTEGPIQGYFARALGVDAAYEQIEADFQARQITSAAFAERIVALYRAADFTRARCDDIARSVRLKPWAPQLLKLNERPDVRVYLVSSGPSFFIEKLAERHGIATANVECSQYGFDSDDRLSARFDPVGPQGKANFVGDKCKAHRFTIGIGDHESFDGPFLSHCTVKLLTRESPNYLTVPSFEIVLDLIDTASALLTDPGAAGPVELKSLTTGDLWRGLGRLTIGSWATVGGVAAVLIALGRALAKVG